jgi:hypothetical protein
LLIDGGLHPVSAIWSEADMHKDGLRSGCAGSG